MERERRDLTSEQIRGIDRIEEQEETVEKCRCWEVLDPSYILSCACLQPPIPRADYP